MDTNKLLRDNGYDRHAAWNEIAPYAAALAKNPGHGRTAILNSVRKAFGPPPQTITMAKAAPHKVWGKDIDWKAEEQLHTALRIPVASMGALMPDAHVGYAMPIGGVINLVNALSPSFVGYDISCMVKLSILDISQEDALKNREHLFNCMKLVSKFGVGAAFKEPKPHPIMDDPRWNLIKEWKPLARKQLGTSGAGNHFFNLMFGTYLETELDFVAIMTHSGSRGVGHKVATKYMRLAKKETDKIAYDIPSGYEWLPKESEAAIDYWTLLNLMGEYADANHKTIHEHFSILSGVDIFAQETSRHNFVWRNGPNFVHRKGATPANKGQIGIIPGSSGSASYVVRGLGNFESLNSASHGAGRNFSRTEAKRQYSEKEFKQRMEALDIVYQGIAHDETFAAYKDIETVMELQKDLVVPVSKMYPKIVIMGG